MHAVLASAAPLVASMAESVHMFGARSVELLPAAPSDVVLTTLTELRSCAA